MGRTADTARASPRQACIATRASVRGSVHLPSREASLQFERTPYRWDAARGESLNRKVGGWKGVGRTADTARASPRQACIATRASVSGGHEPSRESEPSFRMHALPMRRRPAPQALAPRQPRAQLVAALAPTHQPAARPPPSLLPPSHPSCSKSGSRLDWAPQLVAALAPTHQPAARPPNLSPLPPSHPSCSKSGAVQVATKATWRPPARSRGAAW